jgi:hypothetical protein
VSIVQDPDCELLASPPGGTLALLDKAESCPDVRCVEVCTTRQPRFEEMGRPIPKRLEERTSDTTTSPRIIGTQVYEHGPSARYAIEEVPDDSGFAPRGRHQHPSALGVLGERASRKEPQGVTVRTPERMDRMQ